jgi:OOP family OmpA-OmpF porin
MAVGKSIVLEGVIFATGKAVIDPRSEEVLMKAYDAMKANPEVEVAIHGYTDNVGSTAANKDPSLRRAESVKTWMVGKGIEANWMTTKGFGPENPIGDNKTPEGRAKNRRIEFCRTK